jgi:FAD/FMN-containing dehydrogenase/Fe-S oxidoreductase
MSSELVRIRRDATDWEGSDLDRVLHREIDGEVRFDRGTRALYATDSSNYRQVPIGLVVPRTIDAAVMALAICREHAVPVLPRGAGTSLAGQTCNRAVVVDCSRHLTQFEVDDSGIARVEPGVIMETLREAALAKGWDFGPDPSTHDRCTLGGMLGNNSCGVHSVFSEFYGPGPRTSDHVEELDVVTYGGERVRARATDELELRRVRALGGRIATIYERLLALRDKYAPLIRARFPDMPRRVSGYNLPDLLPEHGFHIGRALVGSEATCAFVVGATLRLMRAKRHRALAILGYPDIYAAAAAAPAARERRPVGCEAFDDVLSARIRGGRRDPHHIMDRLPEAGAWLLVEHGADSIEEARHQAHETTRLLDPEHSAVYDDASLIRALADLREAALGVDAFSAGAHDTYEGWEDSAVPPERLAGYLRELHRLYDQYDLHGSLYGHFGQGCVHTRIDFDLSHASGVEQFARFTEDAARLVVAHGGSLSGEHGDGQSRADLWEIMFGPELVDAFGEFKSIWDPDHQMNPGKMAWPKSRTTDLRLAAYDPKPGPIELVHGEDGHDFGHAALRCVGVGKCRKLDHGTMCPSYMVTRDERHSTRGRAHLLFEMLHGDVIDDGWRSESVREALDLCLGCKACKKECPTQVDMASYKAEFLAHHYEHTRRPRSSHAFGRIHRWLGLARPIAPLANAFANTRVARWLTGIASERSMPRISSASFRSTFRPLASNGRRVILWPDTFNDVLQPEVLHAAAAVLASAGYAVEIPRRRLCCGRPLFEQGWLAPARDELRATIHSLARDIDEGTPIVGVEPTCVAMFRDELRALLPDSERAERLAANTLTLGELLADWQPRPDEPRHVLYHRHCHQHAVLDAERDVALLRAAGHDVTVLDSGCCGMAGPFGFERDHYAVSVALAERVLLPAVRADPEATIVTDGFSCREQLRQLGGVTALHGAQLLALGR